MIEFKDHLRKRSLEMVILKIAAVVQKADTRTVGPEPNPKVVVEGCVANNQRRPLDAPEYVLDCTYARKVVCGPVVSGVGKVDKCDVNPQLLVVERVDLVVADGAGNGGSGLNEPAGVAVSRDL